MTTAQERAQCVIWYAETKSPITVQRKFQRTYQRAPPDVKTIKAWFDKFLATGSVNRQPGSGKKPTSEDTIDEIREAFGRSPTKSIRRASRELQIPRSTVHKVLHKRLRLYAYKVQILQALKPDDLPKRQNFASEILDRIANAPNYLENVIFTDESTFHTCGMVNRHNVRIWGSEQPNVVRERVRDSDKVNVWCGLMRDRIVGPFFFTERTVTGPIYLDMLQLFVFPQLLPLQPNVIFQQDGAPPHWSLDVRRSLDKTFPQRWIGRDGPTAWPPRSPDITPLDFFLWGYVKDMVYATPVQDVCDLRHRITEAINSVTPDMLHNTWIEIEYRLDILRATNGAHIEMHT